MTPTEKGDIIDQAMVGDDHDYGDKVSDTSQDENEDDVSSDESSSEDQSQAVPPQTSQVAEPVSQQQPVRPADPNNPLGLKRVGAQFADGKGNIVDKTGKIVARAGENARLWQEASRANAQVQNLTRNNTQLMRELESNKQLIAQAREIAELPTKLGVTREEYNDSITMLGNWKRDPVGVAREVVARAVALGHNVSDILGKTAGDAIETKAIHRLVQEATAPLKQQQEAAARVAQQTETANKNYKTFIDTYEGAELHGNEIANLMAKGRSPVEAYYQVKLFAQENGLKFDEPLGPQVQAMMASRTGQRPTGQRHIPAPMGNGGGRGNESQMQTQPDMADANDDWGSILNSVIKNG